MIKFETDNLSVENKGVLVADDNVICRIGLASTIESSFGIKTIQASDGEEAYNLAREYHNKLFCVILDNTMPKLTGIEVASKIKEINNDIMIIMISGTYFEDEVLKKSGVDHQIEKPYDLAKLKELLIR